MPHSNHSAEEQFSCIALAARDPNPEVAANNARDKKAAMDYLAHAQAAMDARD
jgi:hypothetical protein